MRFVAPERSAIDPSRWTHPAFSGLSAYRDLLVGQGWPTVAELDARLAPIEHHRTGRRVRLVEQTSSLLSEGVHYEQRIRDLGELSTRPGNWHDLLNALVWKTQPALKSAVNARYVAEIDPAAPRRRSRPQYALAHFDEAGAVVLLSSASLLSAWDAHDWRALFVDQRDAWTNGAARIALFGHALMEHALAPWQLMVGKCLVVVVAAPPDEATTAAALDRVADRIAGGDLLVDPLELRPLPLSGIPGWDARNDDSHFYATAPCFRALREGRRYPAPWSAA